MKCALCVYIFHVRQLCLVHAYTLYSLPALYFILTCCTGTHLQITPEHAVDLVVFEINSK